MMYCEDTSCETGREKRKDEARRGKRDGSVCIGPIDRKMVERVGEGG